MRQLLLKSTHTAQQIQRSYELTFARSHHTNNTQVGSVWKPIFKPTSQRGLHITRYFVMELTRGDQTRSLSMKGSCCAAAAAKTAPLYVHDGYIPAAFILIHAIPVTWSSWRDSLVGLERTQSLEERFFFWWARFLPIVFLVFYKVTTW